jgi:hypothetical protein
MSRIRKYSAALVAAATLAGAAACGGDNKGSSATTTTALPEEDVCKGDTVEHKDTQAPGAKTIRWLMCKEFIQAAYVVNELVADTRLTDDLRNELGVTPVESQRISFDPNTSYQLFVTGEKDGDPLELAQRFISTHPGAAVAPNYVMSSTPGWIFGPGDTPQQAGTPQTGSASTTKRIGLVDTGEPDLGGSGLSATNITSDKKPEALVAGTAGHGTFIASLYKRVLPDVVIAEAQASPLLAQPPGQSSAAQATTDFAVGGILMQTFGQSTPAFLSLSFGTYNPPQATVANQPISTKAALLQLHSAQSSLVVVAAAGNDQRSTPFYPAALSADQAFSCGGSGHLSCWMIATASSGSTANNGAPFSNYGSWVTVVADGAKVVGWRPDVPKTTVGSGTTATSVASLSQQGWWRWTGSSFAVPCVIGDALTSSVNFQTIATQSHGVTQADLATPTFRCQGMH